MQFVKMEGIGNDFILTHGHDDAQIAALAPHFVRLCDRRRGVGADGIIFVLPPPDGTADMRMRIFNSDGSEAQICGNGVRCFHRYCLEKKLTGLSRLTVSTLAGPIVTTLRGERVEVDMGRPVLEAARIPVAQTTGRCIDASLQVAGRTVTFTALSMGNPHCVIHTDRLDDDLVLGLGAQIERHPFFPQRVNVEFVTVLDSGRIVMRVFERGCGETMACGTGACAAVVAGVLTGRHGSAVTVTLPGGELDVSWDNNSDHSVIMTGPATSVFCGEVSLPVVN